MQISIGLQAIGSYKRLSYTPWHAIAEYVDNSTQAYFDNRKLLDSSYSKSGEGLFVSIVYDANEADGGLLRIADNSIGMDEEDLNRAMHIAEAPDNPHGRCRYGLGMKTASCWLGNYWSVKTKKLGSTLEHRVAVDVPRLIEGDPDLDHEVIEDKDPNLHYTIVEIRQHNRVFRGRTLGKIAEFLKSMYRVDLREGILTLKWRDQELSWEGFEDNFLVDREGNPYRKEFIFEVGDQVVEGWVGILRHGARTKAGFSILHYNRVIRGYPDSWRPASIFGPYGTNDLVNQRLVGEIQLDDFDVTHTKDDIIWVGDEEDLVDKKLGEECRAYRKVAQEWRHDTDDSEGPSEADQDVAIDEIHAELESPELIDRIKLDEVPPPEAASRAFHRILETTSSREENLRAQIDDLLVKVYLVSDLSPNDPYVSVESARPEQVLVVVNMRHPHVRYIGGGSIGLANYFRHCVYDALAEWKAFNKTGQINAHTIKVLKDQFLRVKCELDARAGELSVAEDKPDGGQDGQRVDG